jgi:hypothetical protein
MKDMGDGTYAEVVVAQQVATATNGDYIPDDLPQTYTYNGDGTLNYAEVTDGVKTWRQTYTYTSGKVTAISGWVLQ